MSDQSPVEFSNVTVICKANIYFDGKVVSHAIELADGSRKTLGLIYPGGYKFDTGAPELMELVAGACRVRIAGQGDWQEYATGDSFEVPGESFFEIDVVDGIAEYVCSFK
ncbi:MAG TPA: pyrimidine/purine nucleoside phosphorylase [Geothermobacteraceae bacterium]|nr:pyrimidine/purine nucleoside phosphorylase [Geothermobacteraceae bacterium]